MKAISLMQPWAWLMTVGPKRIENRTWSSRFRGPVLVHASKTWDEDAFPLTKKIGEGYQFTEDLPGSVLDVLPQQQMPQLTSQYFKGGIVGIFTITDCVAQSKDPWFFGPFGFVVKDARPLPFVACRGALGFWDVPQTVIDEIILKGGKL